MNTRTVLMCVVCVLAIFAAACIHPRNYHAGNTSLFAYQQDADGYFYGDRYYEAYIEFDARGHLFDGAQVQHAVDMIGELRDKEGGPSRRIVLFGFVHGWKNNASENSGNVFGYRRMLNHLAHSVHSTPSGRTTPVAGIYFGWPGATAKFGKILTFGSREEVADAVSGQKLESVVQRVIDAAKNCDYSGESDVVLIGHSFGGLVLERVMLDIYRQQLVALEQGEILPAADLTVLLNEAGPASESHEFIEKLIREHVEFTAGGREYPLILSMTSSGDFATRFAFPGGQFLSDNRSDSVAAKAPDLFGQTTTTSYNLVTTANMEALQSHDVKDGAAAKNCAPPAIGFTTHGGTYCMQRKSGSQYRNLSPYWVMKLPLGIVPDHTTVFRDEVIDLLNAVLADRKVTHRDALPPRNPGLAALAPPPPRLETAPAERVIKPVLTKGATR